ncbi:MAG: hypothetical protein ACP5OG_02645 [Candidatus Nanoarchaeia archaeon]
MVKITNVLQVRAKEITSKKEKCSLLYAEYFGERYFLSNISGGFNEKGEGGMVFDFQRTYLNNISIVPRDILLMTDCKGSYRATGVDYFKNNAKAHSLGNDLEIRVEDEANKAIKLFYTPKIIGK